MKKGELKNMVEDVLKRFPETRNSDIELTIRIWKEYFPSRIFEHRGRESAHLIDLFDLPREDNIKRIRAVIQNVQGRYLPTVWEVAKKRGMKEQEWRNFIKNFNQQTLL